MLGLKRKRVPAPRTATPKLPPSSLTLALPDGETVRLEVRLNPRASRILLRLDDRRRCVVVVAPKVTDIPRAENFARQRTHWIMERLQKLPDPMPFAPNTVLDVQGRKVLLLAADGKTRGPAKWLRTPDLPQDQLIVPSLPDAFASRVRLALKKEALRLLEDRVAKYCALAGTKPGLIRVKDTGSRWGSCAANGNLAFSWRLVLAPPFVLDYVAAHEVAHLTHMDHSPNFWGLVQKIYGNPKPANDWLSTHGLKIRAAGETAMA